MSDGKREIHLPADEREVTEIAGSETEKEKRLAIAQAKPVGDL